MASCGAGANGQSGSKLEFVDFTPEGLLQVLKAHIGSLNDKTAPSLPLKLETLCVSTGMDQGDWSAAWSKALELSLKSADHMFKLEDLELNLHPTQKHLLCIDSATIKKEPPSMLGLKIELCNFCFSPCPWLSDPCATTPKPKPYQ